MFGNPQMHEHQVRQYFENFVNANRENQGGVLHEIREANYPASYGCAVIINSLD